MMQRPCLGCGRLISRGSRCDTCRPRNGSSRNWREVRRAAIQRDGHRCTHTENGERCGITDGLEVDHIHDLIEGGTDRLDNLRTLCRSHHKQRHTA